MDKMTLVCKAAQLAKETVDAQNIHDETYENLSKIEEDKAIRQAAIYLLRRAEMKLNYKLRQ